MNNAIIEVTVSKAVRDIDVNFTTGSGPAGLSAYQTAVLNGYVGTEGEWLASLKGDTGAQGEKGDKGDKGEQGIQGDKGEQGIQGDKGEKGDKGDAFVYEDFTPEQLVGLKGDKGDTGAQGTKGDTGAQGPQGIQGLKGDKGDDAVTDAELSKTSANAVRNSTVTAKINSMDEVAAESVAQIATNKGSIDSEVAARKSADTALDGKVALKAEISPSNGNASALREMYVSAGAEYDSNTKTYTFGGIEGLDETQMRQAFVSSLELVKNKVTNVSANCTDEQYASAKAAYEAKKLLFVDMWKKRDIGNADYNTTTELFSLNGLTDITYDEALLIWIESAAITTTAVSEDNAALLLSGYFQGRQSRTLFPITTNLQNDYVPSGMYYASNLVTVRIRHYNDALVIKGNIFSFFRYCTKLRDIQTVIQYSVKSNGTFTPIIDIPEGGFSTCVCLETVRINQLTSDIYFNYCKVLSLESVLYMIVNSYSGLSANITVSLHTDVYTQAIADTGIVNALAEHPFVQLAELTSN